MTVSRKPCIYALVKSVHDSHFDTTEVRDVSLFKSWKAANKAMIDAYEKAMMDDWDYFVSGAGHAPLKCDDMAMARFSYGKPMIGMEDIEVMWDIKKAETGGLK